MQTPMEDLASLLKPAADRPPAIRSHNLIVLSIRFS